MIPLCNYWVNIQLCARLTYQEDLMTPSNGIVEIRTLAELLSLYEIASDSTLAKDQYRNPLRPYRLIQPEASCQYQKNGKRCSQMHQHGFVVERHDDSKVLIGNCCALNHLGLDDEQVGGTQEAECHRAAEHPSA